MKRMLYIRGCPGTGKKTVADLLAKKLNTFHCWFHDLYRETSTDSLKIAQRVLPGLARQLSEGEDFIFTRPSRLRSTVDETVRMAERFGYTVQVVRLHAARDVLLDRVTSRKAHDWRVSDAAGLDRYGEAEPWPGETVIDTGHLSSEEVAKFIVEGVAWNSTK